MTAQVHVCHSVYKEVRSQFSFTVCSETQNQKTLPSTGFLIDLSCWHLKLHGNTGGNEKMDEVNRCFLISNLFCTNKSN